MKILKSGELAQFSFIFAWITMWFHFSYFQPNVLETLGGASPYSLLTAGTACAKLEVRREGALVLPTCPGSGMGNEGAASPSQGRGTWRSGQHLWGRL